MVASATDWEEVDVAPSTLREGTRPSRWHCKLGIVVERKVGGMMDGN